ncbi:MAG: VOC family protein [Daejeonella sp.]
MASLNPYLNFNGNTEEAFNFYKSVFGNEFSSVMRWKDMPDSEKIPDTVREKIMHISLPIGKETILMGTDRIEEFGQQVTAGTNFNINVSTESTAEADKIFNALAKGGKPTMPMENTFWGSYFGMLTDKFGIHWMVDTELKKG